MDLARWEIEQYVPLIEKIIKTGEIKSTRAGVATSLFGETLEIDSANFPLLHGRKIYYKGIFGELAAMLQGAKTVKEFQALGCNYWDNWADKDGNLILDYGTSWIDFNGVNQLQNLVDTLKTNPNDRRMIISGWRPDRLKDLSLPCCHLLYQWYVRDEKYLDMIWYQRSVDVMIGLPSDIVFAALWNILIAQTTNYKPGKIKFILGDTHVYANHYLGAKKYIQQTRNYFGTHFSEYNKVKVWLTKYASVFDFYPNDMIRIDNYNPMPPIKFELNV